MTTVAFTQDEKPPSVKQKWSSERRRSMRSLGKFVPTVRLRGALLQSAQDDGDKRAVETLTMTPTPSLVLDPTLNILGASKSFLDYSKLVQSQYIGTNVFDLPSEKLPAPDTDALRTTILMAIETEEVSTLKDVRVFGSLYFCTLRAVPFLKNDSLQFLTLELCDLTTKFNEDEQLLTEQLNCHDIYRELVESVKGIAIFMLDAQGRVATWNDGACALKGFTADEAIGQSTDIFYSEEDRSWGKPVKLLKRCLLEGRIQDEGWRYRKDGSRFWAKVSTAPVRRQGKLIGFSKVVYDETEKKEAEMRLISTFQEFSKYKEDYSSSSHGHTNSLRFDQVPYLKKLAPSKQILVVDDNIINQAVIIKLLNALGFSRIDTAQDGKSALDILQRKPFSYDAVLMDINMPVMDGVVATREIRHSLKLDLPIIAVTANSFSGNIDEYLSKGMDAYVSKPIDRTLLVRALLNVLQ